MKFGDKFIHQEVCYKELFVLQSAKELAIKLIKRCFQLPEGVIWGLSHYQKAFSVVGSMARFRNLFKNFCYNKLIYLKDNSLLKKRKNSLKKNIISLIKKIENEININISNELGLLFL